MLANKPHSVDFRVFNNKSNLVEDDVAKQQQKALVTIEMQKLNHIINKPFANGFLF